MFVSQIYSINIIFRRRKPCLSKIIHLKIQATVPWSALCHAIGCCPQYFSRPYAKDAHFYQLFMKKGRPGWMLRVLCEEEDTEKMSNIVFKETTTRGIKTIRVNRRILPREIIEVETEFGKSRVKVCELDGEKVYYPEYEDVAKLAKENDISYLDMYDIVKNSVK